MAIELDNLPICAHITETKLYVGVWKALHQYDIKQDSILAEGKRTITSYRDVISAICSLHNSDEGGIIIGHSWGYMNIYPKL